MCKLTIALLALPVLAVMAAPKPEAKPGVLAAAPISAVPAIPNVAVVTAQSSQAFARNYNTLAIPFAAPAPLIARPGALLASPVPAPLVAAPYATSPYGFASPYLASPYAAPQYLI